MKNNENASVCGPCGGKCCKRLPGMAEPKDFPEPLEDSIRKALMSEKWAIDWWDGDPRPDLENMEQCYYIRPATKIGFRKIFDASWGGDCVNLGPTGCNLSFEQRPLQCRSLKPGSPKKCNLPDKHDKETLVLLWIPYQKMLERVGKEVIRAKKTYVAP